MWLGLACNGILVRRFDLPTERRTTRRCAPVSAGSVSYLSAAAHAAAHTIVAAGNTLYARASRNGTSEVYSRNDRATSNDNN